MPKLTKRFIDTLRPAAKDYFAWDEGDGAIKGFGIRVYPSGKMVFVFQYRLGGQKAGAGRVKIGPYPALTVDQARERARQTAADVSAARLDPARAPRAQRQAVQRAQREEQRALRVSQLGEQFLEDRERRNKPGTMKEYRRLMQRTILPALGGTKVQEVERADIERLHASLSARPAVANAVLAIIGAMFQYAEDAGLRTGKNPCARIAKYPTRSPKKSLKTPEYGALGSALRRATETGLPVPERHRKEKHGVSAKRRAQATGRKRGPYKRHKERKLSPANPVSVAVIELLALSGWREGEALSFRRNAIDFDRQVAILEDSKTGRSVRALGKVVLDLVRAQPEKEDNPFVFPGARKGTHLKDADRRWDAVREAAGIKARLHDLRHSFITVGRELGYSDYVIAQLVGHATEGMTSKYGDVPEANVVRASDDISRTIAQRMRGETAGVVSLSERRAAGAAASPIESPADQPVPGPLAEPNGAPTPTGIKAV